MENEYFCLSVLAGDLNYIGGFDSFYIDRNRNIYREKDGTYILVSPDFDGVFTYTFYDRTIEKDYIEYLLDSKESWNEFMNKQKPGLWMVVCESNETSKLSFWTENPRFYDSEETALSFAREMAGKVSGYDFYVVRAMKHIFPQKTIAVKDI